MQTISDLLEVRVTFSLPDWFAPAELDYRTADDGCSYSYDNPHEIALFQRFPDMSETCTAPESKWVVFSLEFDSTQDLPDLIFARQVALNTFLEKLKK